MEGLGTYLLQECYSGVVCVIIILCFLFANKKYPGNIVRLFLTLALLALVDIIGGKTESFLGRQPVYYPIRLVLSWLGYIIGPGILLITTEILLRNESKLVKWCISIPELINTAVVSTTFFSHWCFWIDPVTNEWDQGPLIIIPRITPLIYLLTLILTAIITFRKHKWESVIIVISGVMLATIVVAEFTSKTPISLRETTIGLTLLAYFMYFVSVSHSDEVAELNDSFRETKEQEARKMIDHCIETLAFTIDAKDKYTKGHSTRVAKYSRMIAGLVGKPEEECREIYLAGLLHDIGKISIGDTIINKVGKLTPEEYSLIKGHPANGALILEKMQESPYLQNGAKFHHERWDGKGYPMGLAGKEIPELGRIIAVADAYDAMTSNRSYRSAMDQGMVKQEIWKGMGTQFDPHFAKAMISLIDADVDYDMREKDGEADEIVFDGAQKEIVWSSVKPEKITSVNHQIKSTEAESLAAFICSEDHWSEPSGGIEVTGRTKKIKFRAVTRPEAKYVWNAPVVLVYSSDDGQVMGPGYEELAVVMSAGYGWRSGSSLSEKFSFTRNPGFTNWEDWFGQNKAGMDYEITLKKESQDVVLVIRNEFLTVNERVYLPDDYGRNLYIAISGERSDVQNIIIEN